ncbi:hypothetical protein MKK69_04870 [Methylobacterium sp. J-026]|uniref:hypothetical protein n=1 Tax=Methylobacterium sp. J-026 TaxID=2836624 RepID=UPI001FB8F5C9|nr:hypothetical protein [Methylobacterium sp. J-026]MCJ2133400.1 hypothetical protein [Methylobacterium sp. J-026]
MPNLLNPVLFTVLGDPITLAKALSVAGLSLDVLGVVVLLVQGLRGRLEDVADTSGDAQIWRDMHRRMYDMSIVSNSTHMLEETRLERKALALLRGTRAGFGLILIGFVLQLLGTLAS